MAREQPCAIPCAETRAEAEGLRDECVKSWRRAHPKAVESLFASARLRIGA